LLVVKNIRSIFPLKQLTILFVTYINKCFFDHTIFRETGNMGQKSESGHTSENVQRVSEVRKIKQQTSIRRFITTIGAIFRNVSRNIT
jgi:hypothetical protein